MSILCENGVCDILLLTKLHQCGTHMQKSKQKFQRQQNQPSVPPMQAPYDPIFTYMDFFVVQLAICAPPMDTHAMEKIEKCLETR